MIGFRLSDVIEMYERVTGFSENASAIRHKRFRRPGRQSLAVSKTMRDGRFSTDNFHAINGFTRKNVNYREAVAVFLEQAVLTSFGRITGSRTAGRRDK